MITKELVQASYVTTVIMMNSCAGETSFISLGNSRNGRYASLLGDSKLH